MQLTFQTPQFHHLSIFKSQRNKCKFMQCNSKILCWKLTALQIAAWLTLYTWTFASSVMYFTPLLDNQPCWFTLYAGDVIFSLCHHQGVVWVPHIHHHLHSAVHLHSGKVPSITSPPMSTILLNTTHIKLISSCIINIDGKWRQR